MSLLDSVFDNSNVTNASVDANTSMDQRNK
jgi:hypothetical protein